MTSDQQQQQQPASLLDRLYGDLVRVGGQYVLEGQRLRESKIGSNQTAVSATRQQPNDPAPRDPRAGSGAQYPDWARTLLLCSAVVLVGAIAWKAVK